MIPEVERTGGGMPRWAFFKSYKVKIDDKPFLRRLIIFLTPLGGCLLTRICQPDTKRKYPHDHSSAFWSLKFGWYEENVFDDPGNLSAWRHVRRGRFSWHRLGCAQAHSITKVSPKLVTFVITGRVMQVPSYWTPEGKKPTGARMGEQS